jgi:FkbM family methyltransferase
MLRERIVHALIGTPLQRPLEDARRYLARRRNPEMLEIHLEHDRIIELLNETIVDGTNCIDVGCHLGSMLSEIVRLSPHGRHIAVEPLAYKAEWLRRKYPQVTIHQVAVGDHDGTVDFMWNPRHSGYSGLKRHGNAEAIKKIEVQLRRLDDLVPRDQNIGFMKVDVEGAELPVFRGARRIMSESRPIVLFECTRSGNSQYGITAAQMFDYITKDLGYRIFLLKDWLAKGPPLDLPRFEGAMVYPFQAFNFVGAP